MRDLLRTVLLPTGHLLALLACCGARPALALDEALFRSDFEQPPTFYVSVGSGHDGNPGSREQPWKTLGRAAGVASTVPPGSVIYVAPGVYPEQLVVRRDDISLIGYHMAPGDQPRILANVPVDTSAIVPDQTGAFPAFDPGEMPLLDGGDPAVAGIAISLRQALRVTIRNFNIRHYRHAVWSGKSGADADLDEAHRLYNVNVSTVGDPNAGYSGLGIALGTLNGVFANGNHVEHALVINAGAEAFRFYGSRNEARNLRVYSSHLAEPRSTDYYVTVFGSRNRVGDSFIWRQPGAAHTGHGYTIKDNADQLCDGSVPPVCFPLFESRQNEFVNNVAVNMGESFVVRHRGVRDNRFLNGTAYGTHDGQGNCGQGNGIVIRDGASNNEFIGMRMYATCMAIMYADSVEDGGSLPTPANDNLITAARIENSYVGVAFYRSDASQPLGETGRNTIADSQFLLTRYLFYVHRPAQLMRYTGNHFQGTAGIASGYFRGGPYATDVTPAQFQQCSYENIAGGLPPGWP